MRKLGLSLAFIFIVSACVKTLGKGGLERSTAQAREFTGEVWDSTCSPSGTHDRMMQQVNATDARECSQKCVEAGANYVLYDPTTRTTYYIDDQDKASDFAGEKVKIKGGFDDATQTIQVQSIDRIS